MKSLVEILVKKLLLELLLVCFIALTIIFSLHFSDLIGPFAETPTISLTNARPECPDRCGNIIIPFPFGIGAGCFNDSWFEIQCNASNNYKPLLSGLRNLEVMEITMPDYSNQWLPSVTVGIPSSTGCGANHTKRFGVDLRGTPFTFSTNHNVFVMEGCDGSTLLTDQAINKPLTGCSTACHNESESRLKCYGDVSGCCQVELPSEPCRRNNGVYFQNSALQYYKIGFYGQSSGESPNCLAATLIKNDSVAKYIGKLSTSIVPVLLHWSWVSNSEPDFNRNAHCWRRENTNITDCSCNGDSAGNPYVLNGCQLKASCHFCQGYCTWIEEKSTYSCEDNDVTSRVIIAVFFALVAALAIALFLLSWYIRVVKRRRKIDRRVKFFKKKLQEHQSSNEGVVGRTKLLTHKELDRATDHFNQNRILGRGGQGTVYKGMLVDGTIVAIKKSSTVEDESQMEQFINELVILSTINHRNVVALLGCCLETEIPLLVYEFISNGTLSQHIHHPNEDFVLTWAMRLKIAADSAGAVAYLHSSSSTPVYHRDIKPANILLDDKYRARVSDFGCSKTIEIDQTHITTLVYGTFGYLDLEYFQSNIFTDKSDVYSFGVVLLELLTSKKPCYRDSTTESKALVMEFFLQVQNSNLLDLLDLLDLEVVKEAKEEELTAVVDLAKCCLNGSGRLRPTMKEVATKLEMIIKPPTEMSTNDQYASSNEGFSEIFTPWMSETDSMSSPVPAGVGSPMYIECAPQLHNSI